MRIIICSFILFLFSASTFAADIVNLVKDAVSLSNNGHYQQACDKLEKAVKLEPQNASLWFNLGIVYKKSGLYLKAVQSLEKAILLNPDLIQAYYSLAFLCEAMAIKEAQHQKAVKHLIKAEKAWNKILDLEKNQLKLTIAEKHIERIRGKIR